MDDPLGPRAPRTSAAPSASSPRAGRTGLRPGVERKAYDDAARRFARDPASFVTGGVTLHTSSWVGWNWTSSFCGPWWGWASWSTFDPWGCYRWGWRSWWSWRWCNVGWSAWPWRPFGWCDPVWVGSWCWPAWSSVVYVPYGNTVVVERAEPVTEVVYVESPPAEPVEAPPSFVEEPPGAYRSAGAPATAHALTEKYVRLGDLYFRAGRYDRAAWAYQRATEQSPDQGSLYFMLADALFAMGDYHYAAFAIRRGIEKDPALVESRADKRTFYPDSEVFDGQLAGLQRFLEDHPRDGEAWLVLGYNFFFSVRAADGLGALRKAREFLPEDEAVRLFLAAADLRVAEDAAAVAATPATQPADDPSPAIAPSEPR